MNLTDITIEKINEKLKMVEIKCLAPEFIFAISSYPFECLYCHHIWSSKFGHGIGQGKVKVRKCPNCSGLKWNNTSINKFIERNNINMTLKLGQKVVSGQQEIVFLCALGHEKTMPFSELKAYFKRTPKGICCDICREKEYRQKQFNSYNKILKNVPELTLKEISHKTTKSMASLHITCDQGHNFVIDPGNLKKRKRYGKGKVCPECHNFNWSLEEIKTKIKQVGLRIEVLSDKYINSYSPLKIKCLDCGNKTNSPWSDILKRITKLQNGGRNTYCSKCFVKDLTTWDINLIKEELVKQGRPIQLLSEKYKTNKTAMKWQCLDCNHIFKNNWKAINLEKQGCPECAFHFKTEGVIRKFLEEVFDCSFNKIKPEWLINPKTGRKLEIDCWNESLKLGFEIQGEHHYQPTRFSNAEKRFEQVLSRDKFKVERFKELGFTLIAVPIFKISKSKIKDKIQELLIENGVKIPEKWDLIELKF